MSSYQPSATETSPVFSKVIAASIAAALTPLVVRWLSDRLGLFIDEENARRALVTAVTLLTTFAAGFLKSEPVRNLERYIDAKRGSGSAGSSVLSPEPPHRQGGPQEPTKYTGI